MAEFISYIIDSPEFEDPMLPGNQIYINQINARNMLKLMISGTGLVSENGNSVSTSPMAHPAIKNAIMKETNPDLMAALRDEIQNLLFRAHEWLIDPENADNEEEIAKCEHFLNYILGQYPFTDPDETSNLLLPTKINGRWPLVPYIVQPIDISPSKGLLAWVHDKEDKIYAYGLTTKTKDAPDHLLLMGTTYPAGQGSAFSNLYNIKPGNAIGEGHSFKALGQWLSSREDKSVIVTGHSKGGTMAMIAAVKWPEKIKSAICLSPAGLSRGALKRYEKQRAQQAYETRVPLNIFINEGDLVPYLDSGFLSDSNITQFRLVTETRSFNFAYPRFLKKIVRFYEAHLLHFANRTQSAQEQIPTPKINRALSRHFLNGLRWTASWLFFPVQYIALFISILHRKVVRFYHQYQTAIFLGLFIAGIATIFALFPIALPGILVPIALAMISVNVPSFLAIVLVVLGYLLLSFTPQIVVKILEFLVPKIGVFLQTICQLLAGAVGLTLGCLAGLMGMLWQTLTAPKTDNVMALAGVEPPLATPIIAEEKNNGHPANLFANPDLPPPEPPNEIQLSFGNG